MIEEGGTRTYRMAWGWQIVNTLLGFITHLGLFSEVVTVAFGGIGLGAAAVIAGSLGCVLSPLLALIGRSADLSIGVLDYPVRNAAVSGMICAGGIALIGLTVLVALAAGIYYASVSAEAARGGPRTYLRLSDDGLEYRLWPFLAVKGRWENVRRFKSQRVLGVKTDLLLVEKAEVSGFPHLGVPKKPQDFWISLNGLEGWPEGSLAEDLHQRLPHNLVF